MISAPRSDDVRQADLFFADLLGRPARRSRRGIAEDVRSSSLLDDGTEPFFGDDPSHVWTVVAGPGRPPASLRDDDLVIQRRRRGAGIVFRARLVADVGLQAPGGDTWSVPRDAIVLRRTRRPTQARPRALPATQARPQPADRPWEDDPAPPPPPPQSPYLPAGGRAFVPQPGTFSHCVPMPFTVVPASFIPVATADPNAAIDTALTAAGLIAAQRGRVERTGLRQIAAEFGAPALGELLARLRWAPAEIARWGHSSQRRLVPRLLLHVPGHFRELARRAPDAREAFVLECLGWQLMARLRGAVAAATRRTYWLPPPPPFVTAVPNPVPALSPDVAALIHRWLFIDTTLPINVWNGKLNDWGTGLAGRQWQAEILGTDAGRPFYAGLATIPAHVNTTAPRATFDTAWTARKAAVDAAHTPHAAGATIVTLEGLRNAEVLRTCDGSGHLPAGSLTPVAMQGLSLVNSFPTTTPRVMASLPAMTQLEPVFRAVFATIQALGWNDLLYETGGLACFRGTRHPAEAKITVGGSTITVNPFDGPTATTVTQVNTLFTAAQRATVLAAARTARHRSNHLYGMAMDCNVPENGQKIATRQFGSMDPRVVALFGAFHFTWGACFSPTDPMHFDYCTAPCAPAAAATGALGPVVAPNLFLPLAAGRVLT